MASNNKELGEQARKLANEIRQRPYRKKSGGITEEKLLCSYHTLRNEVAINKPDIEAFLPPLLEIRCASHGERFAHARPDELSTYCDQLFGLLQMATDSVGSSKPTTFYLEQKATAFVHSIEKMPQGLKQANPTFSYVLDYNHLNQMVREALPDAVESLPPIVGTRGNNLPHPPVSSRTFEEIRGYCQQIVLLVKRPSVSG